MKLKEIWRLPLEIGGNRGNLGEKIRYESRFFVVVENRDEDDPNAMTRFSTRT